MFTNKYVSIYIYSLNADVDFVAQLVEQLTLNQWVVGSSPTEVTKLGHKKRDLQKQISFFIYPELDYNTTFIVSVPTFTITIPLAETAIISWFPVAIADAIF